MRCLHSLLGAATQVGGALIPGASGDDAVDFGGVTDGVDVYFGDGEVNCQWWHCC